jgi:hypothetical protein
VSYADDATGARNDLADAGASVTFTQATPGVYDETTDTFTGGATVTVAGSAVEVGGDPNVYAALELVQSEAPTLLFSSSTYGALPALGASVTWGGAVYTVRSVDTVAPDGVAILATIVVAR